MHRINGNIKCGKVWKTGGIKLSIPFLPLCFKPCRGVKTILCVSLYLPSGEEKPLVDLEDNNAHEAE